MKWYIAAGLLIVAAIILESSLLAYATYVLVGMLLLSRLLPRTWLGHITASREPAPAVVEIGAKVSITVHLRNAGFLPVPWVLAEDMLPRQALEQRRLTIKGKRLMIRLLGPAGEASLTYTVICRQRGYYQIGPVILESGDVFGLQRRFVALSAPHFLLVCPRIVPLEGYELASRRPIGEIVLTHRLFEDPTRIAGIRGYQPGDPLSRVHWRATARTGSLQSKTYEATTLAGATILLDFHVAGYPKAREPQRSELAVTAAMSLLNAVFEMGQQIGLVSNARDAADRIRQEGWQTDPRTRQLAREIGAMADESERLQPIIVPTRRGAEHLQRLREALARVELTDGMSFAELIGEAASRLPRDATVVALLGEVTMPAAAALGNLRRAGYAITAVLISMPNDDLERAHGRLISEGIRDVRHLLREEALPALCRQQVMGRGQFELTPLAKPPADDEGPNWTRQTLYDLDAPE